MSKIVLITGATAGIGEACAIKFAQNGWDIIITGRRSSRLETLADSLKIKYDADVLALCFDVRKLEALQEQFKSLTGKWSNIDVLVNNAGLAVGMEPFQECHYDDWEKMIDTNVKGLLYVTREVTPLMIKRNKGHIINLASLAGHTVYPRGAVYCATKHAVRALSKGMRLDLVKEGIKVSTVSPGAVETEFSIIRFKGDEEMATKKYEGYTPLVAEDIAESVFFIANQPDHLNIEEILFQPKAQASPFVLERKI